MKVALVIFCIAVFLVVAVVIIAASAEANCDPLLPGDFDGPGSLGGVAGTGLTAAEIRKARSHSLGGTKVTPGSYESTAYAPAAGGTNCASDGNCNFTSTGIVTDNGKRRGYWVASFPRANQYGAFIYVWPNPYGWKGPFAVLDTGGDFNRHGRIDFYVWNDPQAKKANAWGRRTVKVSARPNAPRGGSGPPVSEVEQVRVSSTRAQRSIKFVRPTTGPFTSPFGPRWGRMHAGVDIAPPAGTPIVAVADGRVDFMGVMGGYGNFTCLVHAVNLTTCYAHQQRYAKGLKIGDQVRQGQLIGYVGNTGNSTGPHLHFEVRLGNGFSGRPVDPMPYLTGAQVVSPSDGGGEQCAAGGEVAFSGQYAWPVAGGSPGKDVIGYPGQGTHSHSAAPNNWQSDNAIDVGGRRGQGLVAVADGQISPTLGYGPLETDEGSRFAGIRLYLVEKSGNVWYYAHLASASAKPGQQVKRGQQIGTMGAANNVVHLHLASKQGDPSRLLGARK